MPVAEWFQARDADEQLFTLRQRAVPGSVEVPNQRIRRTGGYFSVHEKNVTVSTNPSKTDVVTIKNRGIREGALNGAANAKEGIRKVITDCFPPILN
jgi:hypothetical protein